MGSEALRRDGLPIRFLLTDAEMDWVDIPPREDDWDFVLIRTAEGKDERWYGPSDQTSDLTIAAGESSPSVIFRQKVSRLGDEVLEQETRNLFRALGCLVQPGPDGGHDGAVYYPPEVPNFEYTVTRSAPRGPENEEESRVQAAQIRIRFVLEVKSASKNWGNLAHLRQLDDWVYDISGEETLRKATPGDIQAVATMGYMTQSDEVAAKRYKGVFVFNPRGRSMSEALSPQWPSGLEEFAKKRGFCLMTFAQLLGCVGLHESRQVQVEDILSVIQATEGPLDWQRLSDLGAEG